MKRGRKRKNVSTEEKEMQIPSSALLPARRLSDVSQQTPPVILPIIKKEDSSPLIKKSKTDSIPLNTDVVDTEKNIMENQNLVSECNDLAAVFEPNNELSFTRGSFNLQNMKSEPVSPVACATNATFDDPNYVENPPVILPIIKKEDSSPLIKKSKTDSIPLNTNVVDTEKNIMENQNLVSECNDLAVFEPNNKLSFTPGSFNLQNVKSEPVSPVACVTNATFDDPNYVEQNGGNLDHFKIKREPRSRSSSTETVLNEESLQLQQDECRRSSSAETLLNEESLELPMDECQSETSFPISDIYQVINPDLSSLRENSDLSSRKEADRPSFITPVHSPNISFSQHENELHMLTTKISLVTKLFKYNTFFKEIVIADAKESLNFLNSSYPSNGSFNLFFSNDTYLGQQEIPAIEPVKSIPIISSIPTVSKDISTNQLKKIIKITQKLPDLSSPIKNNSESDSIIKDTNVNAPALTVSTSQLPIITKQQKESDHTFNTNIRIKDEPIDDYDSALVTSPSVNHLVLTCNKRSAEETPTKMQGFLKKTKISQLSLSATCIDSQIEPGDCTGKCDSIDTSKGGMQNQCLESARITSHTLKTLTPPNSSSYNTVSDNMLQNNATMCRVFSDRGTENRVATESFVSNSSSPKFTSYLHFLPGNIVCTDSSQRAVVSAEPMTSVSSNFTVLTTKSDSVVTKNYSQSTTAIDKFPACSAMQHFGEKNLGKERTPGDTNVFITCNKIDTLNCSQPGIISSDSVTTKKGISKEIYLPRKSAHNFHDPCAQKYIGQNFMSQVSAPGSTEELIIASPTNQQNHNRFPTAYKQNHQHNKLTSAPRFEIASSVQQIQVIGDSNVSHNSSRRSEEFSSLTSRDPRKTKKSVYETVFGLPRQDLLSLRRDIEGNKFIETEDLPLIILNWKANWLSAQKKKGMCPPIWKNYLKVKDTYQNLQHYYDTYQPLHLLKIWYDIYQGWEKSVITYDSTLLQVQREGDFMKMSCTVTTSAADRSNHLMKEDILICSITAGRKLKYFGRVVGIVETDLDKSPHPFQYVKPGVYKKLSLEITCDKNIDIHFPAVVQLQNVTNIGVALKQNDALKCMNPVMKAIILNPRENEQLIQTTIVPPITNVSCMLHSIRTFEHRVTIINSPSPSISATATYQVASRLKTNSILLVAVKDKEAFLDLATRMKNLNIVLAIKENEVPLGMRTLTVNYCDFATLMSRQIILTFIPSMFFGKIESRLKKEPTICIICEAQCFFETETALLLAYKIEHLILIGMSNIKASTPSLLARYAFDVSLFHRISKKS